MEQSTDFCYEFLSSCVFTLRLGRERDSSLLHTNILLHIIRVDFMERGYQTYRFYGYIFVVFFFFRFLSSALLAHFVFLLQSSFHFIRTALALKEYYTHTYPHSNYF